MSGQKESTPEYVKERNERMSVCYEKYYKSSYYAAVEILKDEKLAEDIVNEVFCKILERWTTLPELPEPVMQSYFSRAARNCAIDYLRHHSKESLCNPDSEEFRNIPSKESSVEECIVEAEQKEMFDQVVGQLSPKEQKLYQMRFQEERSTKEIAEEFGDSTNHVNVQIHRLKDRIRKALRQKNIWQLSSLCAVPL